MHTFSMITATAILDKPELARVQAARHQMGHALALLNYGYGFSRISAKFAEVVKPDAPSLRGAEIALAGQCVVLIEAVEQFGDQVVEQTINQWIAVVQHDLESDENLSPRDLLRAGGHVRWGLKQAYEFARLNKPLIDELADKLLADDVVFWDQFRLYEQLAGRRPVNPDDVRMSNRTNKLFDPLDGKIRQLDTLTGELRQRRIDARLYSGSGDHSCLDG